MLNRNLYPPTRSHTCKGFLGKDSIYDGKWWCDVDDDDDDDEEEEEDEEDVA